MGRLENSWRLVKASAAVLRADKELIVFPIASGAALLLVTATFAFPLWASGYFDRFDEGGANVGAYVVAFLFYLVQYVVVTFANAALVGAALIRLRGGDPTLADGLRIAWSRAGVILGYSLIGATVGVILRAIQERAGIVGQVAAGIVGIAWGLVTFLVVPVLVVEQIGPIEAIRRSGALLKRTWGEQIVGNFGVGLAMLVVSLGALVVVGPIVLLAIASGDRPDRGGGRPGGHRLRRDRRSRQRLAGDLHRRPLPLRRRGRDRRLLQFGDGPRGLPAEGGVSRRTSS
jgi:hypothetical protein